MDGLVERESFVFLLLSIPCSAAGFGMMDEPLGFFFMCGSGFETTTCEIMDGTDKSV